jgi:hypothetical protein
MQPLSDEWFAAARAAVDAMEPPDDLHVAVGQVVVGRPGGDLAYQLVCGGGTCTLTPGIDRAAVVLTESYETAVAVAEGRRSAGHALLDGDIVLRGDGSQLIAAMPLLDLLGAAVATVSGAT